MAPAIFQDMHVVTTASGLLRVDTELPPSPTSLNSTEFHPSRDDQEQSRLQECWDKSIAQSMDLPEGYQNVYVLMIKWQDKIDQLRVRQEVNDLTSVFQNIFKYDVTELQLEASNPQLQLKSEVLRWAWEHDGPDNLLIVYYAGHGIFDEVKGILGFSPTNNFDDRTWASWNTIEKAFREDVKADVFGIMDCCYASDLNRSVLELSRTYEMLAASHIGSTTPQPGDNSFTRSLIKHLKELVVESSPSYFTTRHIQERMQRERASAPPALWSHSSSSRHIRLSKLKPLDERPKKNMEIVSHARFLHLGFALEHELFLESHIEKLTKQLPDTFKQAGVPVVDIKWLGCRKVGRCKFKEVAEFVVRNRGDLSAISPAHSSKRDVDEAGFDEATAGDTSYLRRPGPPRLHVETTI
jgi:hypothetical protein